MSKTPNNKPESISRGLRERMQDCQIEVHPELSAPRLRRVGPRSWELPGTDFTLDYCPVNSWFVAYQAGQPLFTTQTLAEAEERFSQALSEQAGA